MELQTTWSNGHTQTVLCLDVSKDGCIASGGEGGQFCLWDSNGTATYKRTFPSDVDVNSVCFSPVQASVLYLSAGPAVEVIDIRCPESSMTRFTVNEDDVNQLSVDPKDAFLAACDDDGIIKIINIQNRKVFRTLKGHDNICSSVSFHPNAPRELASGGLDCIVNTWEITRGRPLVKVNMREIMQTDENMLSPYIVNPPFVHSIDYSSDGNLLACGLENARVVLLERKGKRNLESKHTLEGHTLGVTQVCFIPNQHGQADQLLLTAGNDCRLMLWDTGEHITTQMEESVPETPGPGSDNAQEFTRQESSQNDDVCTSTQRDGEHGTGTGLSHSSKTLSRYCVKHKDKINWIVPRSSEGGMNLVLVADVSENISVYKWQS